MNARFQRITPFLWFENKAEEAVAFYVSIFDNARIAATTRYNKESAEASGQKDGSVMTVAFELDGQPFVALNGGAHFQFSGAISFIVNCQSQAEVDHYWNQLSAGGDPTAQQCGWLKDRYGVSWQIVPTLLPQLLTNPDPEKAGKTMHAMLQMKKIDMDTLKRAAE
jgi:predicted 3-demethylubiquinone-9 3-methyltransferase (glyoxalase superfamily)